MLSLKLIFVINLINIYDIFSEKMSKKIICIMLNYINYFPFSQKHLNGKNFYSTFIFTL